MTLPRVAIVGRPNVGKSSLLNRLAGRRVSIVEPTAGVTRDRVCVPMTWEGHRFEVMDTGGLGLVDEEKLKAHIESQIHVALEEADFVLFVVDGKEGLVPGDQLVAQQLRRLGKPVQLVVNKVESYSEELIVHEWRRLGFGEPHPVSAKEGFGMTDLLGMVCEALPTSAAETPDEHDGMLKFAVVGKRNSGKSTLINRLVGEERVIVSEIPGTTRDSVDVVIEHGGRELLAIDTAGVRKKSRVADAIELFSYSRATESIKRADVVVHMFDVFEPISQVDKKVARFYASHHKPVIIVGNKIDAARETEFDLEKWDAYIRQQLSGIRYAPVAFLSAKDGDNVDETLDLLFEVEEQASRRISTAELNDVLHEAKAKLSPRSRAKLPKLYYGTQIGTMPITIVVFVNEPKLFRGQWERYLGGVIRERFDIEEVPIRLVFRQRERVRWEDRELPPAADESGQDVDDVLAPGELPD